MASKISYAQSSDIKARSFREYRHDMKKKAVAELEFLAFLQALLAPARVEKHGADKDLWFLQRSGTLTQEPDYVCVWLDGRRMLYEFQYAEGIERLKYLDFKVSKVGRKKAGRRIPHGDRNFFYVVKPTGQYAFIEPDWIIRNGKEAPVPAWGNRVAFRVALENFQEILVDGEGGLQDAIAATDDKNLLLEYQRNFLIQNATEFSRELQNAVDRKKLVTIVPTTLEGFFRICFLMERMDERPLSPGVWLVYLMSFFREGLAPAEIARWMFAFDFLYFHADGLSGNEERVVREALDGAWSEISAWQSRDGAFVRDPSISPVEETVAVLHAANLLEDVQQDFAVRYGHERKVRRIFDVLADFSRTARFIRECG